MPRNRPARSSSVPRNGSNHGRPANGHLESSLPERLRRIVAGAPVNKPLPTTRELGRRFGLANTTVFRVLKSMAESGELWQHPTNGRYFPPGARALLDRPKPVACLIRRLELGSELYRELLEGVSAGCGTTHRTMLLWHDARLVNHPDPQQPPIFASATQQRGVLEEFLSRHGDNAGGFLLDHVWSDEALRSQANALRPAVMVFRSCTLPGIHNVAADFRSGALQALAHLLGRGFEHIVFVEPFTGDPAVSEFALALKNAATELGCGSRLSTAMAPRPRERVALLDRLARTSRRHALLCPEDNVALLLVNAARTAGIRVPDRLGVLSVMGTDIAARSSLSSLRYDFRALGRLAIESLAGGQPARHILPAQFLAGDTT